MMVTMVMMGVLIGWFWRPLDGSVADGGELWDWASLVDVLGKPAEAFAVALPLQHAAHEHLQWSCVQLLQRDIALGREEGKKTN